MEGTVINFLTIIMGSLIGLLFKKGITENIKETVMQGLSLGVIIIGIQMALKVEDMLVVIISLVIGGIIGELLKIETMLMKSGKLIESKMGNNHGEVAKAFVTTSLLYCVGAMAVVGAIENGLTGKADTLIAKSLLDGVSSIFFASTMGIGVMFSALPVLIYQGAVTLFASSLKTVLSTGVINQITATGGILIVGISVNLLGQKNIKVGNLLPAIIIVALITIVKESLY